MFRKTLEKYLGKEIFPKPMDENDEISKIELIVAEVKGDQEFRIGSLNKDNFSNEQLGSMLSALKNYNKLAGQNYQIKFEIKTNSAYWTEEKINLYLKTKHDTMAHAFLATRTLLDGLQNYKSNIKL